MSDKSIPPKYEAETLTDNTKIIYCAQCADCRFWGQSGDPYSNKPTKSFCDKYKYPKSKPIYVVHDTGLCEYKEPRGTG